METIVCKFGGTSVADADAIKRVKSIAEADESRRFIVVSAPGKRFAGDTKVTDLFYTAVKAANENGRAEFEKVFSVISARFRAIVAALFPYSSFPGKILAELNAIGRRVYEEKDEDFAAYRGEHLTGKILAEFLGCAFIDAEELILFTDGGAIDDRTYEIARSRLKGEMRAVIPGFYGKNADGKVRTFPRGGGDITGLVRMVLSDYNVLHYNNVEDTLRAVRERRPQLILIDIVVYDREEGLALCRRLKGSKQTDDIPVVLLTADDTPEDARIFCEAGVDAWMEKPFDVELFRARVRQLVSRHVDLQQKLKIGQILGKHEDIVVESADEKFMSRVTEIVEQNIPNEEFSLEVFAREMRVSRSVLNMRIQGIVGKSPMELLRNARMQRAAQLLATNAYDVAQVGYMVGFSDPRYFSTSFKKQFGVSPRAYMQNHHNA